MSRYRWNIRPPIPAEHPASASGLSPLITQLLYNRGLTQASQIESFITADESLLGDPRLLPDMNQAVARIYQALLGGENIAIYGDFDVDGITGTALLAQGLEALGARITPYIPHRLTEGHGLNTAALEQLQQQGISLVVTADCGITGVSPVKQARARGMDIVITDHHTPTDELPPATAVVDPMRTDSAYPFSELAGVGVAFKLLQALYQDMGQEKQLERFLDLVALGTVADMMPLQAENRYLVREGLKQLNKAPRAGIRELMTVAGLGMDSLGAEDISWVLAPSLNAAGRLEHAMSSYRLLVTESPQEAHELAVWLGEKNAQRQSMTARALTKARKKILAKGISALLLT
ncbi:MAG: DHH family phosphoesterase, partial [Dehalococcoidales bacterium]